jgi:YHS domain-containing protein
MVRIVLIIILVMVVARVFWRIVDNIIEAARGGGAGVPQRGVPMVRDPVCGTFVLPERAVSLADGRQRIYFCSQACRDKYRARTA